MHVHEHVVVFGDTDAMDIRFLLRSSRVCGVSVLVKQTPFVELVFGEAQRLLHGHGAKTLGFVLWIW